jgi:CheY-like chemotaxis protein
MAAPETHPTILIVDDEPLFRSSVVDALATVFPAYSVHEAGNGREALELMSQSPVDVLVTDINMPVMDGLRLMLALRERSFRGPIIVVTAFGSPQLRSETTLLGVFDYLEKPIVLAELITAIRNAVESDRGNNRGLTLAGFVHLLAAERKSGRLRILQGNRQGDLLFLDGTLVDACFGSATGNEAALALLRLDKGSTLEFEDEIRAHRTTVTLSLNQLLIEAPPGPRGERTDLTNGRGGPAPVTTPKKEPRMANVKASLEAIMELDGAIGVALVDYESGMCLGQAGGGSALNLDVASAGNSEVVRSKLRVMTDLGLSDSIEDILISLGKQYHLIRPLESEKNLFLYCAFDRKKANLAMARHRLSTIEAGLEL